MRLRAPAIATGVQSMDLMRTPPSDQRNALASNSKTCLFKAKNQSTMKSGVAGVQDANTYDRDNAAVESSARRVEFFIA